MFQILIELKLNLPSPAYSQEGDAREFPIHVFTKYYDIGHRKTVEYVFISCRIIHHSLFHVCLFVAHSKQIADIFVTALNQGLIQFELKAGVRIILYVTQQTLGRFVTLGPMKMYT